MAEVLGPPDAGKTSLALAAVAATQRAGHIAAWIDADRALCPNRARALGVAPGALAVARPPSGERALEIAEALARGGHVALIIIDSLAALAPEAELRGARGAGLTPTLLARGLRSLAPSARRAGCALLFTNQLRARPGAPRPRGVGGDSPRLRASVRLLLAPPRRATDGLWLRARLLRGGLSNAQVQLSLKLTPPVRPAPHHGTGGGPATPGRRGLFSAT